MRPSEVNSAPVAVRAFVIGSDGSEVVGLYDHSGLRKVIANVVSLAVGIGVDLVSDAVVALIAIEADVVGAGSDPDGLAFKIERSFP